MAVSGTVPSARKVGFDPQPPARWLKRATAVLAVVGGVVFFSWFGTQRVPPGMDTVPTIPPGSLCIIDRRQGTAQIGYHVFVDVPGGGTLLSQVTQADAAGGVRHEPQPRQCAAGQPHLRGAASAGRAQHGARGVSSR